MLRSIGGSSKFRGDLNSRAALYLSGAKPKTHLSNHDNLTSKRIGFRLHATLFFATPSADSEIVMVDLGLGTTFSNKIGHGTTLGRPFQAFRSPTKLL